MDRMTRTTSPQTLHSLDRLLLKLYLRTRMRAAWLEKNACTHALICYTSLVL